MVRVVGHGQKVGGTDKMIMVTDELRVRRYDDRNVIVEKYEAESKSKRDEDKWKFVGYYTSVKQALLGIQRQDMLVDLEALESIEGYVKAVERQMDRLVEVFREFSDC